MENSTVKTRVLFMCETVTMAHPMRSASLANALPLAKFEVHFAGQEIPASMASQLSHFTRWPLPSSVSSANFLKALEEGKIPYTKKILAAQISEDLELIDRLKPDLVVGDFRLSLLFSARLRKVPFVNITNLTWHPSAKLKIQAPVIPLTKILGVSFTSSIFKLIKPILFRQMAKPFNQLASEHGLPFLGSLEEIYTSGDFVFYADMPGLVETDSLPANHVVAGPVPGELKIDISRDIQSWLDHRPLVMVSLGSSGPQHLLPELVRALGSLSVQALVSTSGRKIDLPSFPNVKVFDFLPIDALLSRASVLVCNGGSPSCYAAASQGVPVLAIPSNLDQFNCSQAFVQRGVGLLLRPEHFSADAAREKIELLLKEPGFKAQAKVMKSKLGKYDAKRTFRELIQKIVI